MEVRRRAPRLSSDEVALVLRRAADLEAAAEGPGAVDGFDPADVEDAAREVGLSPAAVRQAIAELHAGTLAPAGRLSGRRRGFGAAPLLAVEARMVVSAAQTVHEAADGYLRRQSFALRRHHAEQTVYRRRTDLGARLRRLVDLNGSLHLTGVRSVALTVTRIDREPPAPPGDTPTIPRTPRTGDPIGHQAGGGANTSPIVERHMVRLEAELVGNRVGARLRASGAAMAVGGVVTVAGLLAGWGLLALGAGVAGAVGVRAWLGRRLLRQRRDEVREVLAGLLDVIEDPATARPPLGVGASRSPWPSSWSSPPGPPWPTRRWLPGNWTAPDNHPTH